MLDHKKEKTLLFHGILTVVLLLVIFTAAVFAVHTAVAGSALYYIGCAAAALSLTGAFVDVVYTLGHLESLGLSDGHPVH